MSLEPEIAAAAPALRAGLAKLDLFLKSEEAPWFTIDDVEQPRLIGRTGSGGTLVLLQPQGVLYVGSEGRAGIVAPTFEAFIQLVVAHPYWPDILKFAGGGDLHEMRRAAKALEETLDDEDEINEARVGICGSLDLAEAPDPVGALYEAVAASNVVVRAPDGTPCTTLFNRFTVDDNPMLRDAAD